MHSLPHVLVALLSTGVLAAQNTWVVDPAGGGNFTTLGAAEAAAAPGDTIRVRGTTYAINVNHSRAATVRKNRMADTVGIGIEVDDHDAVIDQNKIVRSGNVGIIVGGADSLVSRNALLDCMSLATETYNQRTIYRNNRIRAPTDIGILVQPGSDECTLDGNRIDKPGNNGVDLRANGCVLTDNTVRGSQNHGFEVSGTGNELMRNSAHGSAASDLHCDLQANTVKGNNHFGTVEDVP